MMFIYPSVENIYFGSLQIYNSGSRCFSSERVTYYQQPPMQLDNIRDSVAVVHRFFVGEMELDGDAKVTADDDDRRYGKVEGEHGDDKREALVFHLSPGE